eukprot:6006029-Pyramimonas_sp.AAC.1
MGRAQEFTRRSMPIERQHPAGGGLLTAEGYRLMCPGTFTGGLAWWGKDACYGYKVRGFWDTTC